MVAPEQEKPSHRPQTTEHLTQRKEVSGQHDVPGQALKSVHSVGTVAFLNEIHVLNFLLCGCEPSPAKRGPGEPFLDMRKN